MREALWLSGCVLDLTLKDHRFKTNLRYYVVSLTLSSAKYWWNVEKIQEIVPT